MKTQNETIENLTIICRKFKIHFIRLKINKTFFVLVLLVLALGSTTTKAQSLDSIADNFNISLNLKNMHLWHGSIVTSGAMMATSLEYQSTNQKFVLGLWGGSSFDGDYKEFSYYSKYNFTDNFYAELVSHNNYSDKENPDIFSYNKHTSPNFLDIALGYTVSDNFPLKIYWATILFGGAGDYENDVDGSENNSYSNYVELSYRLFQNKNSKINIFAGGAFSFTTDKTFYSEKANLINLGMSLEHKIKILSKTFPVTGTAFWNPETKVGALQIDISLF